MFPKPELQAFNALEVESPVWQKLREHLEATVQELHRKNEHQADPVETARLRGRIHQCRLLLEIGAPKAPVVTQPHVIG